MKDGSKQSPPEGGFARTWGPEIAVAVLSVATVIVFAAMQSPSKSAADAVLFLGRFHPLAVHLPIGILVLVVTAEALTLSGAMRRRIDPGLSLALTALVVSSVGSFFLGQLLASGGGFAAKLVGLHRTLTFVAVLGTALCFVLYRQSARPSAGAWWRNVYRATLLATVGVLSIGAHYGGSITRGEGYLTHHAPGWVKSLLGEEKEADAATAALPTSSEPRVFDDVVLPILRERCVECHGGETKKGGLRVDSLEAILKGGDSGPTIVAGNGAKSLLVTRMLLPPGDDERMPPDGKPGPSEAEIELIGWWIDRGASDTLRVRDALAPSVARSVLEQKVSSSSSAAPAKTVPSSSAAPSASESAAPSASATDSAPDPGASTTAEPQANASLWSARVRPILVARCGSCHGAEKQKGKLRVDSIGELLKGGKAGPAVVPKAPGSGTLLARVHLPLTNDKHMPPPDYPQMTAKEIALVTYWIEDGATADTKVDALPSDLRAVMPPNAPAPRATASVVPTQEPTVSTSTASTSTSSTSTPTASSTAVAPPLASFPKRVSLYRDLAEPVFADRCAMCHASSGPEGDLDVGSVATLLKGGMSGPGVVPGDAAHSLVIERMKLPAKDSDHMPPEALPQPSPGEIAALELWISTGAKEDTEVDTATLSPAILLALVETLPRAKSTAAPAPTASASTSGGSGGAGTGGNDATGGGAPSATATATSSPPSDDGSGPPSAGVQGGCASCAVPRDDSSALGAGFATFGMLAWSLRRTRRRRPRR